MIIVCIFKDICVSKILVFYLWHYFRVVFVLSALITFLSKVKPNNSHDVYRLLKTRETSQTCASVETTDLGGVAQ